MMNDPPRLPVPSVRLDWLQEELESLEANHLRRAARSAVPLPDEQIAVDGRSLLDFASNDYLSLSRDGRVLAGAREALDEFGTGATASALVAGRRGIHERLEIALAEFEETEAALLFPSGYAANVGTLMALLGPEDVVFCDRFNHASLVDGCKQCGARLRIYRHDNLDRLARELARAGDSRRRAIVTDSVFSMDGDVAPLVDLAALADRYDALLIVDEAHATGVFGATGAGVAQWRGVRSAVDVHIGTLSKGLASLGGFVAGSRLLIEYLWNRARTQMFSTALPPAACGAALAALEIIKSEPARRTGLLERSHALRDTLTARGLPVCAGVCGPIIPVLTGSADRAVRLSAQLAEAGFYVPAIRPPTVARDASRLRISVHSGHSAENLKHLADAITSAFSGDKAQEMP